MKALAMLDEGSLNVFGEGANAPCPSSVQAVEVSIFPLDSDTIESLCIRPLSASYPCTIFGGTSRSTLEGESRPFILVDRDRARAWVRRLGFVVVYFFSKFSASSEVVGLLVKRKRKFSLSLRELLGVEEIKGTSIVVTLISADLSVAAPMTESLSDPVEDVPMCTTSILQSESATPDTQSTRGVRVEEWWLPLLKRVEDNYGFIVPTVPLGPHISAAGLKLSEQLSLIISTANSLNCTIAFEGGGLNGS
ncbi:hypothetical protein CFOL_v3_04377 [Cephalotus follicularis]|uniref:Uncharacterized protein n=1 Tax=Cephalotus follicularis TaxID=3775 RepID=A0A1Q3AYP5_CEPFO|nr:hypothetical protein CFOL_v3_04377 [Cephalotus follicularis]